MKTTMDPLWDSATTTYWSIIELNVGILCACLPTLRPLASKYVPTLLGTRTKPSTYNLKLQTIRTTKLGSSNTDTEAGIYMQKDVEFQSTTALQSGGRTAKPGRPSADKDSLEEANSHLGHEIQNTGHPKG